MFTVQPCSCLLVLISGGSLMLVVVKSDKWFNKRSKWIQYFILPQMTKAIMTNLMTDLKDKTRTRLFSPLGLLDWWNKTQIHCLPLACDHRLDHMITDLLCWNIARLSNCPDITILNFEDFEGWFGHELVLWITLRLQIQKCWWRIACEYYQGRYRSANKTPHLGQLYFSYRSKLGSI